jgi:hypothetical protein
VVNVDADGHGILHFRTYVNCTQAIVTDCDRFQGNSIYGGGFAVFYLWKVAGSKAYGTVTNSGYSYQVGTTVTLVRNPNDTLTVYTVGPLSPVKGCGPQAPPGTCGA